jgi:hypothetical protein
MTGLSMKPQGGSTVLLRSYEILVGTSGTVLIFVTAKKIMQLHDYICTRGFTFCWFWAPVYSPKTLPKDPPRRHHLPGSWGGKYSDFGGDQNISISQISPPKYFNRLAGKKTQVPPTGVPPAHHAYVQVLYLLHIHPNVSTHGTPPHSTFLTNTSITPYISPSLYQWDQTRTHLIGVNNTLPM